MNKHTSSVSLIDGHIEEAKVIKALEWHVNDENHCAGCPIVAIKNSTNYCVDKLLKSTIDLIKQQQAENKELIEDNADLNETILNLLEQLQEAKSEAIKEFAERLCEGKVSNDPVVIAVKTELKMTEGKNNG